MPGSNEKPVLPEEPKASGDTLKKESEAKKDFLAQVKKMLPVVLGVSGADPIACRDRLLEQIKKLVKNPGSFSGDLLDSLFGTGADGISMEDAAEKQGRIDFAMELPEPVRMPACYSVAYHRHDENKNDVVTSLERDGKGNIRYIDAGQERVFVRTGDSFRAFPVLPGNKEFGKWDGVLLSARSVRKLTERFWNCADQTFIKWIGAERTEDTEYLGRRCGLYHAQPGTLNFSYRCDMVVDDETGICLCRASDKVLKGAVFNETEDGRIRISIGDYSLGGADMDFHCTKFETENISFRIPSV